MNEIDLPPQPTPTKLAEGREAEIFAWDDGMVLRLLRADRSPLLLERETAAMSLAFAAGLPVPRVIGRHDLDGRAGLILQHVDGRDLFAELARAPWSVRSVGAALGRLHADRHRVAAAPSLPSIADRIAAHIAGATSLPPALAEEAHRLLAELPNGDRLCHGDFHLGNVLVTPADPVVIDWPNAAAGDPHADVARTLTLALVADTPSSASVVVRLGDRLGRPLLVAAYLRAYRRTGALDRSLLARWRRLCLIDRLAEEIPEERGALLARLTASTKGY